ncbi:MAG: glycosyltransferase family 4 protein [Gammaproteobacteria bacterium]
MTAYPLPDINLIALRHGHHAAHSGYGAMADVLPGHIIRTPDTLSLMQRVFVRALRPMVYGSQSRWYQRRHLLAEAAAAKRWLSGGNQVFHFLYGENSYRYLGHMKRVNRHNYIVCTYHTPPQRFDEAIRDRSHLQFIDAAIAFTRDQVEYLRGLLAPERVFLIPHGVDVNHFRPAPEPKPDRDPLHCLFVGQHLRDFDTLAGAARAVAQDAGIRFSIVTPQDRFDHFNGLDNVELLSGVSDAELLTRYQRADVFVFPLLDATANCALQEAMACGLPIVSTDMPAVRDYVDDACALLTPRGDVEALAAAIRRLEQDRGQLTRMGAASRKRAQDVSLENVASQTVDVYRHVTASKLR